MNSTVHNQATGRPSASPATLLGSVWHHRHLLFQLIRRDVAGRYRGSFIGLLWSLIWPCVMLGIYVFIFGHVFLPVRAAGREGPDSLFAVTLFSGLLIHGFVAECLGRAPTAILAQPSYVKKVVFPLELLPLTVVGTALLQFLIGSSVLLVALMLLRGIPVHAIFWPILWLPLLALAAGISLGLSAITVYLRDMTQITGFVATVILFMSPIFYPLSSAPVAIQGWLTFNPLTIPIEGTRALLIQGRLPQAVPLILHAGCCLVVFWLGWWLFQRMRRGFSDVI